MFGAVLLQQPLTARQLVQGNGRVEGVVGLLQLLANELATDVVQGGEFGDRLPGASGESELLAFRQG